VNRDQIIADTFRMLDRSLRSASIAQIGGFRPPETPLTSWFGGRFVGASQELWPLNDGEPMLPLLQVRTDELPYVPAPLAGVALFTAFAGPRKLPVDLPAPNGSGWLIRCYNSLDGLEPLGGAPRSHLRPFPIRWSLPTSEGPGWQDAWHLTDLSAFNELPDAVDLLSHRYTHASSTKVGGWPSYIQGIPPQSGGDFVFQIGSEEKSNWMWGDNGIGYFYWRDGEWMMQWECY
jgi:hypothetical protein